MKCINVIRSSMPPLEEYMEEIRPLWENRWLTNFGDKYIKLSSELSQMFHGVQVTLFCNGHQALEAAFSIFPPGAEVITTPFTFVSTTLAILKNRLVPVFCDIEPDYYTLNPDLIESHITEKTVAIAPVHVYGNLCNWRKIEEIAKRHSLMVIYDAAHAFGVKDGNISCAELGDISMLSFHATKVFHTIEGGALVCHDSVLSARFKAWESFGIFDGERSKFAGTNAKMNEFSAAMGLCNLRHLDDQIMLRKKAIVRYREKLEGQKGLVLCREQPDVTSNYAYFPVRIIPNIFGTDRDEVLRVLMKQNIYGRKYFYPLTSDLEYCRQFVVPGTLPIAEKVSSEIMCLPLYSDLIEEDVDRICDVVIDAAC